MPMVPCHPERVFVHKDSWEDRATHEMLQRLPDVTIRTVEDVDSLLPELQATSDYRTTGKRTLILTRNRGSFMKPCPGAGAEVCCNYTVINYALNCHMDCTYCVLQSFLNNPALTIYTNLDDLTREVGEKVLAEPQRTFRIGTGETADSLALDDITHYSNRLIPLFRRLPNAVLELKTKSALVANLQGLDHGGHTIVSWSLNPNHIIRREELKTAPLKERLEAARQCRQWGYRLAFHFDPIIYYEGWERDYGEVVHHLFAHVDPNSICWISLGCLRFTHDLKEIVRRRFPHSRIAYGEFVPGNHGKLRYFRPIREEVYAKMLAMIRSYAPQVFVYLCMENCAVWERSFGIRYMSTTSLAARMDSLVAPDHRTGHENKGQD